MVLSNGVVSVISCSEVVGVVSSNGVVGVVSCSGCGFM